MLPTLIGVMAFTFIVTEYVPGGPMDQVIAMLRNKNQQGEVAKGNNNANKNSIMSDIPQKMRLARKFNLHKSTIERFLETFIWYHQDSISSTEELDDGDSLKFIYNGKDYLLIRDKNEFYAYRASLTIGKKKETVVYDREKKVLRAVDSGKTFSYKLGKALDKSTIKLEQLPLSTEKETSKYYILKNIIGEKNYNNSEYANKKSRYAVYVDEPLGTSLLNWDNWHGLFLLKFGDSIRFNEPVTSLIVERLPVSASLGVISFIITYLVTITLGILKAVKDDSKFDVITSMVILIGYSIPGFVLGVILLALIGPNGMLAHILPLSGLTSSDLPGYENWSYFEKLFDYLRHLIAPIICYCIGNFAVLTFLTKNSILEQFSKLYVTAARARGLTKWQVLFKHILRNAMIPLITGFPSNFLAMFFAGSILIERIFQLNGLGLLSLNSVLNRDFPVVMGSLFIFTLLGLIGNLLTDISYVIVDPRINFNKKNMG